MGLLQTLRSVVKTADKVTRGIQPTILFRRYTGQDGAGAPIYSPPESEPAAQLRVLLEDRQEDVRTISGDISKSRSYMTILDTATLLTITANQGIKESDQITLPNGDAGQILAFGGFVDAGTGIPVATEVWLG